MPSEGKHEGVARAPVTSGSFASLPSLPPPDRDDAVEASVKRVRGLVRCLGFHPRKPTHCPEGGANNQTVQETVAHVIRAMPGHPSCPNRPLSTLFGTEEGGKAVIRFLEVTKAKSRAPFDLG
jgi:hypothetical protein